MTGIQFLLECKTFLGDIDMHLSIGICDCQNEIMLSGLIYAYDRNLYFLSAHAQGCKMCRKYYVIQPFQEFSRQPKCVFSYYGSQS